MTGLDWEDTFGINQDKFKIAQRLIEVLKIKSSLK